MHFRFVASRMLISLVALCCGATAVAGPKDWFAWTGEANEDYLNLLNWRWAGGTSPPSGVASLGNPTSLTMLLSQRHEIGQAVWNTTNNVKTTVPRTANLDGQSASYLAWNGGNGVFQTYNGIEIDSGMNFRIYNGATYTLGSSATALTGFTANGLGTNPAVSNAWTGNHLRTSVHVFGGGTFRASSMNGGITALSYYTGNAGIFAEGHANVTMTGDYFIGGFNDTRGTGGGHLTLKGYDSRSQLNIGKNTGGTGTLRMYPALDQSPISDWPYSDPNQYSSDITGSNPSQLRIILDSSNSGGLFNTVYTDTLEIRNAQDPAATYLDPVQFSVQLDGYAPTAGHVFPIILANSLTDGPVSAQFPQRTGNSLGLTNLGWDSDFTVGTTTFRFLQTYNNQKGVFLAVQGPPERSWYGDGVVAGGDGTWTQGGNTWGGGGSVGPLAAGELATFTVPDGQVTIDQAGVTAGGGLNFEPATTYQLSGGSLTLGGGTSTANTINVQSAATATISAPLAGVAGLNKAGTGELVLSGSGTLAGNVLVSEGTVRLSHASPLGTASVFVSGGTLATAVDATIAATRVDFGGRLTLDSTETHALDVASLTIDRANGGALVDVGVGRIEIAGGADATALKSELVAGRGGNGDWTGTEGILSSVAATSSGTRTVGYRVAGDTSAVVAFAAPGDTDLDGVVNTIDLVSISAGGKYGTGAAAVWSEGDFNYDGVVNSLDLVAIASSGVWGTGNYLPLPTTPNPVPEPATLGLLAAATIAGLAARLSRTARTAP